jgi:Protein of unknown function (DUF3703)
MTRMPDGVRDAINSELSAARAATTTEARWHSLERAHVLSQAWAISHAGDGLDPRPVLANRAMARAIDDPVLRLWVPWERWRVRAPW